MLDDVRIETTASGIVGLTAISLVKVECSKMLSWSLGLKRCLVCTRLVGGTKAVFTVTYPASSQVFCTKHLTQRMPGGNTIRKPGTGPKLELGVETATRTYSDSVDGTKLVFTRTHTASSLCCTKRLTQCMPCGYSIRKTRTGASYERYRWTA